MKKSMRRLVALMLALMLALGTSALAAGIASNTVHVNAQPKPEGQETEPAGETESIGTESAVVGDLEEPVDPDQSVTDVADDAEEPEVQTHTVVLQDGRLNVRAEPSMEGAIIGAIYKGDQVEVIAMEGDWARIKFGDAEAYVFAAYLISGEPEPEQPAEPEAPAEGEQTEVPTEPEAPEAPAEPEEPQAADDMKQVEVEEDSGLNIRTGPSMDAEIIGSLEKGDFIEVLGVEGNWTKIALADGSIGYVASSYLAELMTAESQPSVKPEEEPVEEPVEEPADNNKEEKPAQEKSEKPEEEPEEAPEEEQVIVVPADVDVRQDADGMSEIIETVPEGAEIKVIAIEGDWVKVEIDGVIGYIYIDDLPELLPEEPEQPEIDPEDPEAKPAVKVTIFSSRRSVMAPGEEVELTSKIENLEYYTESMMQWQVDKGEGFEVVPGATEDHYSFEASIETLAYDWKLLVYYR